MGLEFIWQLPNSSDSRYGDARPRKRGERIPADEAVFKAGVSDPRGARLNYFDYLHQVARAAELLGFDGLQIQNDPAGDEPWIIAGYLTRSTRHLTLLVEFEAARGSAVYAAKNAVSHQRFSGDRFAWKIDVVGDARGRRRLGDFAADADQLPRIEEFIRVARGVIGGTGFDFSGRFFAVQGGGFGGKLAGRPVPPVYLSGTGDEALRLSAGAADVHVFTAEPPVRLHPRLERLRQFAEAEGRAPRPALRVDLIVRESAEEAVADAQRSWRQRGAGLEVVDGLWHAPGAVPTLVGSYGQVVDALAAYAAAGIGSFLLGASPHLEEAWRVGEHLLPPLRERFGAAPPAREGGQQR